MVHNFSVDVAKRNRAIFPAMDVRNRVLVFIFAPNKGLLLHQVRPVATFDCTEHNVFLLDLLVGRHGRILAAFATFDARM